MNQKIHSLRMYQKARRLGVAAATLLLALALTLPFAPTPLHGATPHTLAWVCPCP
jgi:hypothetical protein